MGVSKNSGIPKWMVYNGKPYEQMDNFGVKTCTTILGNIHIPPNFMFVEGVPHPFLSGVSFTPSPTSPTVASCSADPNIGLMVRRNGYGFDVVFPSESRCSFLEDGMEENTKCMYCMYVYIL